MHLPSKIVFAATLLPCSGLCVWAAIAFGGPFTTMMWTFAAISFAMVVAVWLIPSPRPGGDVSLRVVGAAEPTFRLVRDEPGARGEVWQLRLGSESFSLLRPDGRVATTWPRAWAILAIQRPGFIKGELLGFATEEWSPPEDERRSSLWNLAQDARSIAKATDQDGVPRYWFQAPKVLAREVGRYIEETPRVVGSRAAVPLLIKSRRGIRLGLIGMIIGLGIAAFGISMPKRAQIRPGDQNPRVRTIALGAIISVIGFARIVGGLRSKGEARRYS
jgi:hypothetical protein